MPLTVLLRCSVSLLRCAALTVLLSRAALTAVEVLCLLALLVEAHHLTDHPVVMHRLADCAVEVPHSADHSVEAYHLVGHPVKVL